MRITIRRTGLRTITLTTDQGTSTLSPRFLRTGGTIDAGPTSYVCSVTESGWALRVTGDVRAYTTTRTGIGSWTLTTPEGRFTIDQCFGRSSTVLTSSGTRAASMSRHGTTGLTVTSDSAGVTTPAAVVAALTIMSRRRRRARFTAAIR